MASLLTGLGLSLLCKYLDDLIRFVYKKSTEYASLLEKLKIKLKTLEPAITDMEQKYRELGRQVELDQLKDFEKVIADVKALVNKFREDPTWYKKPMYLKKLKQLDESLSTQIGLLDVRTASEVLKASASASTAVRNTKNLHEKVEEMCKHLGSLSMKIDNSAAQLNKNAIDWGQMMKDTQQRNSLVQNQAEVGWLGVPEPPLFTVGLKVHLDELKKKLVEDDGLSMALIAGHAGSGKTTLAKSLCHDEKVKGKFRRNIIFVNVSQRSNIEIVLEIFEKKGTPVTGFQTEEIALHRLQKLVNKRGQDPLLLVLDNVWSENTTLLESLDRQQSEMSNYKILVTSRQMLKGLDLVCHVEELNDDDALSLLHSSARLAVSPIPVELQLQVVKCCKKLPLFIEVVGRSLSGKDVAIWKDRVNAWSSGSSIINYRVQLRDCLQSSLDALCEENAVIKECFMDLASFPQGRKTYASALIDMWTAVTGNKDTSCYAKLHQLSDAGLVKFEITKNKNEEKDDYYVEPYLTQHDLMRDLAIHLAEKGPSETRKRLNIDICRNKFPEWWKRQMDQPYGEARLVSISTDIHFESKWRSIDLPRANVLVLNFQSKKYELPEFLEKMKKLKVLLVTSYGFSPAEIGNLSLLACLSKLKRIMLEQICISSFNKSRIELKRLQKLSFFKCNLGHAFSKGSSTFFEAFPNLLEIKINCCRDLVELPADICDRIQLKKLSVANCHNLSALPNEIGKLVNLELLMLRSCGNLTLLPDSVSEARKLRVIDVSHCFNVKMFPEHIGEIRSVETLRLSTLPPTIYYLDRLTHVICNQDTVELWEHFRG